MMNGRFAAVMRTQFAFIYKVVSRFGETCLLENEFLSIGGFTEGSEARSASNVRDRACKPGHKREVKTPEMLSISGVLTSLLCHCLHALPH